MKTLAGFCCLFLLSVAARGQSDTTFNFRRAWQPARPWTVDTQRLYLPQPDSWLSSREMASAVYQRGLWNTHIPDRDFYAMPYHQLMGHPHHQPFYRINALNRWLIR